MFSNEANPVLLWFQISVCLFLMLRVLVFAAAYLAFGSASLIYRQDYSDHEVVYREDDQYIDRIVEPVKLESNAKFYVDYEAGHFVKDGKPFRYISGSLHYSRVPNQYWRDRLTRFSAMGLDAVQTLVPWNFHEPWKGQFDFSGDRDLISFLRTAQSEGLLVLLRIGPYICAEWELGGLPAWLLMENPSMKLRSNAEDYMTHVRDYWGVLLPKIVPMLYQNGGPVIMVQIENEYGSYPSAEPVHSKALYDLASIYLGPDVVYYTTDGNSKSYFTRGAIKGTLTTVDFAPVDDPSKAFADLRNEGFNGPFVNSELYTGWFQHWGEEFQRFSPDTLASRLNKYLNDSTSFSVSMYMFLGGTTFGFFPGANMAGTLYQSDPNSYDYDSPLTENGGCGIKCHKLREVLLKYSNRVDVPDLPANVSIAKHGLIQMEFMGQLVSVKNQVTHSSKNSLHPLTFEELRQDYGFVLYQTFVLKDVMNATLTTKGLADEGIVMVNGVRVGILSRTRGIFTIDGLVVKYGQILSILVHNMGRVNYGGGMNDLKGVKEVRLDDVLLTDWSMYSIPLNSSEALKLSPGLKGDFQMPGIFLARFKIPKTADPVTGYPKDTYLRTTSFSRGVAFLNGINLGRYWNDFGPVNTLYVPGIFLKAAENELMIFELDHADCSFEVPQRCAVEFLDHPVFLEALGYSKKLQKRL